MADLIFADMGMQKTMRNAFKKMKKPYFSKCLWIILKQTALKHGVIVEASLVASSYAKERFNYHVDFSNVHSEMLSIIIFF